MGAGLSGRRIAAMVVSDKRGVLETIASRLAPTGVEDAHIFVARYSLPAMAVNDDSNYPDKRGVLESIASRLAPTGVEDAHIFVARYSLPAMVVNDDSHDLDNAAYLGPSPAGWLLQGLRMLTYLWRDTDQL
ncbi:hypothetical protein EKG40_25520 [Pseudomonas moorei]|nr:hypothetical protein EKG40_25520 [Pseudomonas moorei]